MFNFNLQDKALNDLSKGLMTSTQFAMLYLLNKNANGKAVEMYNTFLMDKIGISVRMVQYNIKKLEEMGYIKVQRATGKNVIKKPNLIEINNTIDFNNK